MEMSSFVRFYVFEGREEQLQQALVEVVLATRSEEGCLTIHAFRSERNPRLFLIYSRWKSEAAFDHHAKLAHTLTFLQKIEPFLEQPVDVTRAEEIV
jgi:quinol monooxygenase YgiN